MAITTPIRIRKVPQPVVRIRVVRQPKTRIRVLPKIIPADGEDGEAATVTVGTVTTLPAGSDATVVNSGTESAAVLDFGIPQGANGTNGTNGNDGADGAVWFTGAADPSSGTGQDGDFYLQTGTGATGVVGDVWEKASGTWSIVGNIRGEAGSGSGDMLAATYDPQNIADDAFDRANHTGTQLAATISDFSTAADLRIAAAVGVTVQAWHTNLDDWSNVNPVGYYTALQIDAGFQPLDADLTSWAGVTRASGFDTFAATPSSANLRALLTDEVGTGAAYFVGGALGTPASGTLTNCAGLPVAGITSSTSTALGVGSLEVGHASDTTISRSASGVIAVEGIPLYPSLPQNSQSAAYTTVLADAQKHILHPTADNNARTFTIAANASVAYPVGTCITFINQINTVTIAINSDTLVLASAGTTGSRTLAANGIATAIKIASTTWIISGVGLT